VRFCPKCRYMCCTYANDEFCCIVPVPVQYWRIQVEPRLRGIAALLCSAVIRDSGQSPAPFIDEAPEHIWLPLSKRITLAD
jgi:hypothetical protein